jgi:hypothetical protein
LGNAAGLAYLRAREINLQNLLSGNLKTEIEAKFKGSTVPGSNGEFPLLMAALKRDNGIIAFNYDLLAMARVNLEEAVNLRADDALAQLYLGKVISLTAQNDQERREADDHFLKAIQYDAPRGVYPDPHLEHALYLIDQNGDKSEISREIEAYITLYQRENAGGLPDNMAVLYDYLSKAGNTNWLATPATVISNQSVEGVRVNTSSSAAPLAGPPDVLPATGPAGSATPAKKPPTTFTLANSKPAATPKTKGAARRETDK